MPSQKTLIVGQIRKLEKLFLHKCASLLVYAITAMPSYHISIMMCTRPFGRIDNVALKRWALFTVE